VSARRLEMLAIGLMMIALLVGGRAWIVDIAQFHGFSVAVLGLLAVAIIAAFRRNFRTGGAHARLDATRDAAFLAGIAAAIAFVLEPARWSLGATIVATEFGLLVTLLGRILLSPHRIS
jgi:hypothetical protein